MREAQNDKGAGVSALAGSYVRAFPERGRALAELSSVTVTDARCHSHLLALTALALLFAAGRWWARRKTDLERSAAMEKTDFGPSTIPSRSVTTT